jgi:hypothetical protein
MRHLGNHPRPIVGTSLHGDPMTDPSSPADPFVVIRLASLRRCLASAYEAEHDVPTPVYVELKLADILAEVERDA